MEIKIIQIGNSKGIRLSKTMMEKYNFEDSLELEMTPEGLLLKPLKSSRKDWDKAFKQMHKPMTTDCLFPMFRKTMYLKNGSQSIRYYLGQL
jgi:antitoxin MazE